MLPLGGVSRCTGRMASGWSGAKWPDREVHIIGSKSYLLERSPTRRAQSRLLPAFAVLF
jgi:hypothetical protein